VALIERRPAADAYKVVCTHAILPPAGATIERLGLTQPLTALGVPRPAMEFWSPYSDWVKLPDDFDRAWGVTRRRLDPLLRDLAVNTPGVHYYPGRTAERLCLDERLRPDGIVLTHRSGRRETVRARLLVAADGRNSDLARLANLPGRVRPHNRFVYFAYWEGIDSSQEGPKDRVWLLDPDAAAQFANEDDLTVLAAVFHRSRLRQVRADIEAFYLRHVAGLPDGPDLHAARRVSRIVGKLEMPNVMRPAATRGIAFIGDAALATDPVFGVGITFAFQTAEWLSDLTAGVLDGGRALDHALARYRRTVLRRLGPHHLQIADFSTGRRLRGIERRALSVAAQDPTFARAFGEVFSRQRSVAQFFDPRIAGRLAFKRPRGATRLGHSSSRA
jgi:2-polyprenyl-6-methoxyphenol hydroxylase-like FAD-dependent oxidoreductase